MAWTAEQRRDYQRKYREEHREHIRAQRRASYMRHKDDPKDPEVVEKHKAQQKKWYEDHKDRARELRKAWVEANREHVKEANREYYQEWYAANHSYKKTKCRFYNHMKKAEAEGDETKAQHLLIASHELGEDRASQVKKGLWVDERTGEKYKGCSRWNGEW